MHNILKIISCFLIFSNASFADEYDDKVVEMLELSNSIETTLKVMDNMLRGISPNLINQLYHDFTDKGIDVVREDVVELVNMYRIEFLKKFETRLIPLMITVHKENLTLEELDEIIIMMKTPSFQMYAMKGPILMEAGQKAGQQLGATIGMEVMQDLIAKNPKFQ